MEFPTVAQLTNNYRKTGSRMLRHRAAAPASLFLLLLAILGWFHFSYTSYGKPYETWDEIVAFNSAHVLSGPTASWNYRYGTLDTLIQFIANVWFDYYDESGRQHQHI